MRRAHRRDRGVSLVEALVALAVMAFGLLGVVGMQVTMRANSDVAKQRAEAVRIAQAAMEDWRSFERLDSPGSGSTAIAFEDVATYSGRTVSGYSTNTSYSVVGTSTPATLGADDLKLKTVTVAVNWTDRAGQTQGLSLSSAIAGIAPELAGSLSLSGDRAGTQRPGGSQLQAHDLHNGTSGFIPFNRPSGDTTAFLFNNITGLVTLCSSTVLSNAALKAQRDALLASGSDPSILVTCSASATMAVPLSGTVSFATVGTPTQALTPSGMAQTVQVGLTRTFPTSGVSAPVCYTEAPTASSVQYICAVPITALSSPASVWSGYSYVTGASITGAAGGSVVCRYTTGPPAVASRSDLIVPAISNVQHPRAYLKVASGLAAQNFLLVPYVTGTASDCPDGSPLPSGFTTYPQPATAP